MFKHPRTFHLPWSEEIHSDDKVIKTLDQFLGKEIVVTEKRDGENTSLYCDGQIHARSLSSTSLPWQTAIKSLWAERFYNLPQGWRVVGENLYARHSVAYTQLTSWFEVFAIFDENNTALSWEDTIFWCNKLDLELVPILYMGIWDESKLKEIAKSLDRNSQEGFVVRPIHEVEYKNWSEQVVKWVRKGHVQTDQHWTKHWVKNNLR